MTRIPEQPVDFRLPSPKTVEQSRDDVVVRDLLLEWKKLMHLLKMSL